LIIENLTEDNFLDECIKHYRLPCYTSEEFLSDLKRVKYIKKLLTRFKSSGILEERLILNHIIILNNVFGPQFLCRVLFLKLLPYMEYIKPFLLFINILPEIVFNIDGKSYDTISINMSTIVVAKLRQINQEAKER
jgi:hypothetical protein